MKQCEMRRVMIIGQPGAGKSTLARNLGAITGLPVFHIDTIHWMPGWIERDGPAKDLLVADVHARERWIFEGGRSSTWRDRAARADTLIWLDFPLWLRAWRVLRRRIEYRDGRTRPDLPENCPERLNWEFTHWIWTTRKTGRARMRAHFEEIKGQLQRHRLSNPQEVKAYLVDVAQKYGHAAAN